MNCCCEDLMTCIERNELAYDPVRASFWFYFKIENEEGYGQYCMRYCPYCGTKLPKDLIVSDDYFDELEKVLGKDFCDIKDDEIPEEFKSDEWWRKRNIVMYEEPHKSKLYEENIEIINGERVLKVY